MRREPAWAASGQAAEVMTGIRQVAVLEAPLASRRYEVDVLVVVEVAESADRVGAARMKPWFATRSVIAKGTTTLCHLLYLAVLIGPGCSASCSVGLRVMSGTLDSASAAASFWAGKGASPNSSSGQETACGAAAVLAPR